MNDFHNLIIEPLNKTHNRPVFQCGVSALDRYLKKQATQDIKRRISRVYVATEPVDPKIIIGYYTLSSLSLELEQIPEVFSKKLPKHQVPAALIARLAVNQTAQGNGVGKMLLTDAIKRILVVSDEIAIYALVVDAINKKAQYFYEQFGFTSLCNKSFRLFLPLQTLTP